MGVSGRLNVRYVQPEMYPLYRDLIVSKGTASSQLKPPHIFGNEVQRRFSCCSWTRAGEETRSLRKGGCRKPSISVSDQAFVSVLYILPILIHARLQASPSSSPTAGDVFAGMMGSVSSAVP